MRPEKIYAKCNNSMLSVADRDNGDDEKSNDLIVVYTLLHT